MEVSIKKIQNLEAKILDAVQGEYRPAEISIALDRVKTAIFLHTSGYRNPNGDFNE